MLTFLTGLDSNAKRLAVSRKINSLLQNKEQVILLVPEQIAFDRERDFLFSYGELTANRLKVTSFTHFAEDILEHYGITPKPKADKTAKTVLMSLAVEELSEELTLYKRYAGRQRCITELLSAYAQMKQAGLNADLLDKAGVGIKGQLSRKAKELSMIFRAYEALLSPRFTDETDNLITAEYALREDFPFEQTVFFIDDFRGFTGLEHLLLNRLIAKAKECFVSVFSPDLINSAENEPYLHALNNANRLKQAARLSGVSVREETTDTDIKDEFFYLRSGFYQPKTENFNEIPQNIGLLFAQTPQREYELTAIAVRRLIQNQGYRLRDIGILVREESALPGLTAAFRKYSIPVFEDTCVPLFSSPFIRFVLGSVQLAATGFDTERLLSVIKTGMSGISREDCSLLETYAYRWQINYSGWEREFTGHPDGFCAQKTEESEQQLIRLNELRRLIIEPIADLKAALKTEEPQKAITAVFDYLTRVNAPEYYKNYAQTLYQRGEEEKAVECSAVWDAFADLADALRAVTQNRHLSPQRFFELFRFMLTNDKVGTIPAGMDEIILGLCDRTRFLNAKAVFLVGCNEGVFPKASFGGGIFSFAEIRTLTQNGFALESLNEQKYDEERLIVLGALCAPQKKLYVSCSAQDEVGNSLEPSEIIYELKGIFPNIKTISYESLLPGEALLSFQAGFEEYAGQEDKNTCFSKSLQSALSRNQAYRNKLTVLENARFRQNLSFQNPELAQKLYGKSMNVSASKIENYHKCPFMHFCRYGLGLSKPQISQVDSRINGLMIHDILEHIMPLVRENREALTDEKIKRAVHERVKQFTKEKLADENTLPLQVQREIGRTEYTAVEIIKRMVREFGVCDFLPYAMELFIGDEKKGIKAYVLPMSDGSTITLTGSIDRVDIMELNREVYVRVIDYKTGGKKFALQDVFNGFNMQMLLYLFAFLKNGKGLFADKRLIPAGVLYVPANTSGEKLGRNSTEEEVLKQKLKNGRMNGIYLESETVLKGMEADPRGVYIDAYIDDKGKWHGSFLTLREFERLNEITDEMIIKTCTDMKSGVIPVRPEKDSTRCACDYCDFASVCLHEEADGFVKPAFLSSAQAKEMLHKEDEDNG